MFLTVPHQLFLFGVFFALGLGLGLLQTFLHELCVLVCKAFSKKKAFCFPSVVDCLLVFAFGCMCFMVNVAVNYGVIRVFEMMSVLFGLVTGKMLLGKFLALASKKCYDWASKRKMNAETQKIANR